MSVLPRYVYERCFAGRCELQSCRVVLNCYNGSKMHPLGFLVVPVEYEGHTQMLKIYVLNCSVHQPVLLGRDFISAFNLQLCRMTCHSITDDKVCNSLTERFKKLFVDELGRFNKYKITLKIKPNSQLKFFKPRPVPFALKPKVELELKRLVSLGILEKIDHSDFATPIVPVLKADGNVRICGDFSVTLNKVLYTDNYPLPRIEELFSKLHGGVEFSKIDLSRAYNQLVLDDSKNLTCINTHKGLFRFNRLVFGLANAPFIFQRAMEQLLSDIEGTCIFLDDILITGPTKTIHLERLKLVLSRLQDAGLRLKREKCEFFKSSVEYLGFIIDKNGLHKSNQKIKAILDAQCPKNVSELKSFLGMVNYYRCFVPNTSSILNPLHSLLKKSEPWIWGKLQNDAFTKIKQELISDRVLAHYNPELTTIVTADAGPAGLGAVLAQRQADGSERVVAYASRSLSKAERNYAQIQKEATAIVFAVKKFHHYLYGRTFPFTLRTDHKPLLSIIGTKKGIPELAANRLQRYALFLSAYNYNIEYVKGENNTADFLSRSVPIGNNIEIDDKGIDESSIVHFISDIFLKPITVNEIRKETERDEILRIVINHLKNGWPRNVNDVKLRPYFLCRLELFLENGCLLRYYYGDIRL